jgi:NAD(P)-dependent dehydrogenase (short-subunit alcohol dehydrogenase family)
MIRDTSVTWNPVAASSLDLAGMKAAVVGGTGGLGRALSRVLASRGASVTVVGQTFRDAGVKGLAFLPADLSLMKEARRVADALSAEQLDLLLLTAGIFAAPARQVTAEGLERDLAVSYLNRLVMVRAVAPRLGTQRAQPRLKPRVVIMGYPGTGQAGTPGDLNAERAYRGMAVHMNTVAGNELLVLDGAKRYPDVSFFGLNPGLIKTNIRSNFLGEGSLRFRLVEGLIGLLTPTPEVYADRIAPLLVSPDLEGHSGALFNQKAQAIRPSPQLLDAAHASAFLAASEALVSRAAVSVR